MRGLFKLDGARIWSGILIIVGVILLIIAIVLRWNMANSYPISDTMVFTLTNTAVLIGLGITLIIIGITVIILCNNISRMMQSHDEELYRRIKNAPTNNDSD